MLPGLGALIPPRADGRCAWPLTCHKTLLPSFIYKMDQQKSFSLSALQASHCLGRAWVASEGCWWWFPHPAGGCHTPSLLCDTAVTLGVPHPLCGDLGPRGCLQHLP